MRTLAPWEQWPTAHEQAAMCPSISNGLQWIAVYDGNAQFPENASAKDRELMELPLLSLALLGDTPYATDALKGGVLLYDKQSGELKKEIAIPLACGIAVEPSGKIWVEHGYGKVSVLSPEDKVLSTPISDLKKAGRSQSVTYGR